jgi:hypothetical protein
MADLDTMLAVAAVCLAQELHIQDGQLPMQALLLIQEVSNIRSEDHLAVLANSEPGMQLVVVCLAIQTLAVDSVAVAAVTAETTLQAVAVATLVVMAVKRPLVELLMMVLEAVHLLTQPQQMLLPIQDCTMAQAHSMA